MWDGETLRAKTLRVLDDPTTLRVTSPLVLSLGYRGFPVSDAATIMHSHSPFQPTAVPILAVAIKQH